MKTVIFAAIAAATAVSAPAFAQDAAPFTGPRAGVTLGYDKIGGEDGFAYGVTAGYDLSLGSAFVGVEGEYSASTGSTEFPSNFAGARDGLDADGQYYLGARGGLALTPGIAAYGKVGYTALDTRSFTSAGNFSDLEENATGLRFGGGVQVALPGPLEARLEYRRSRDQLVAGVGIRF